ncbi:hypothetical protein SAMN06264364_1498 [Quadrisphaera granulorum]|uniref:Secreted protein n=1 Tax=Quadrisphaera granulorum TaxID=317664 RepID=A0A315ZLR9_9ACTN|nr:hypothetical protein [Quadrisphaera granulorum]PWJ46272.1 hypothetical protein BXY45_1498 [Quadrisphaera granulorum]SZE99087.1 hypothetical protein SAMN06264364_1498 [Quadrisphaera granulorum]
MREAFLVPAVGLLAALALAGCSAPTEAAAPAESPSVAESAAPAETAAAAEGTDLTEQVRAAVGEDLAPLVTSAEQTEPGRVQVDTSISDPRTDDSAEAGQAIYICDAVSGMDAVEHVSVMESDGSTFVVYGHPAYPAGECSEV